jgi:hypothetical protein
MTRVSRAADPASHPHDIRGHECAADRRGINETASAARIPHTGMVASMPRSPLLWLMDG